MLEVQRVVATGAQAAVVQEEMATVAGAKVV